MLKAHKFHVKFTVHTIMSEGGDVTMEEDYTLLSYGRMGTGKP
jgi:hypothetical protein